MNGRRNRHLIVEPLLSLGAVRAKLWMIVPPCVLAVVGALIGVHLQATYRAHVDVQFPVANDTPQLLSCRSQLVTSCGRVTG